MPTTKKIKIDKIGVLYGYCVAGRGNIPVDMLRYDCAWPADERAVMEFATANTARKGTGLLCIVEMRSIKPPTANRWASFGWEVL